MTILQAEIPERLLTIGEVAAMTGLTVGTLYHFVSQNRIPVVRISSRCLRFRRSALLAWFDELTCEPTILGGRIERKYQSKKSKKGDG